MLFVGFFHVSLIFGLHLFHFCLELGHGGSHFVLPELLIFGYDFFSLSFAKTLGFCFFFNFLSLYLYLCLNFFGRGFCFFCGVFLDDLFLNQLLLRHLLWHRFCLGHSLRLRLFMVLLLVVAVLLLMMLPLFGLLLFIRFWLFRVGRGTFGFFWFRLTLFFNVLWFFSFRFRLNCGYLFLLFLGHLDSWNFVLGFTLRLLFFLILLFCCSCGCLLNSYCFLGNCLFLGIFVIFLDPFAFVNWSPHHSS